MDSSSNSNNNNNNNKTPFSLNPGKLYQFREDFDSSMIEIVFKQVAPMTLAVTRGTLLEEYSKTEPDCLKERYVYEGDSVTLTASEFRKFLEGPLEKPFMFVGYRSIYRFLIPKSTTYYGGHRLPGKKKTEAVFRTELEEATIKSLKDAKTWKTEPCFLFMPDDDGKSGRSKIVAMWDIFEHIEYLRGCSRDHNEKTKLMLPHDNEDDAGIFRGSTSEDGGLINYGFPDYEASPQGISDAGTHGWLAACV